MLRPARKSTTTGVTTRIPATVVQAAGKTMTDPARQGPTGVPAVRRKSVTKSPKAYRCFEVVSSRTVSSRHELVREGNMAVGAVEQEFKAVREPIRAPPGATAQRPRILTTTAGTWSCEFPKLRAGSFFPSCWSADAGSSRRFSPYRCQLESFLSPFLTCTQTRANPTHVTGSQGSQLRNPADPTE